IQGKYTEAEPLYARCQAIEDKVLGPEHPSVAATLNNRAGALSPVFPGRCEEVEPLNERCLAIEEKVYGPDHPEVGADLTNWAGLLESLEYDMLRWSRCMSDHRPYETRCLVESILKWPSRPTTVRCC
ncbi:unnamed protein product, partial [Scytosiphon promiscuus]